MSAAPASPARVKICGLREPAHAQAAIEAGADFLGVMFAQSRRRVTVEQARAIRALAGPRHEIVDATVAAVEAALAQARPLLVGVFARQSPDEINRIAREVDLDLVQLSGGEHPSVVKRIQRPVLRVIHIEPQTSAQDVVDQIRAAPAAIPMLDTHSPQGGGSGEAFDWSIAAQAAAASGVPFMLAGGLRPDSVGTAIAQARPWAVDVSSGVETEGVKDPAKIRDFIRAARATQEAPAS